MVAWNEYKAQAKKRGSLALELYAIESLPAKTPDDLKANLAAHLDYQRELEVAGQLVMAGPISDATGETMIGGGIIIYRAASMDEARALAEADPMHSSGARSYTMRRWMVNEGNLSLNIGLSTQTVKLS